MRRLTSLILGSLLCAGCPGTLEDPAAFSGGGAGGSPGPSVEEVFLTSCGNVVCHDSDQPAAGLDLVSPDIESRTVGVGSSDLNCGDEVLIVPGDPDESYILKKIEARPGICGGQMPIGTLLDMDDIAVIQEWVLDLGMMSAGVDVGFDDGA